MKIFVAAKPSAKEEKVEAIDENHFRIAVKEPPSQGKANEAIIKAVARHFGISAQRVRIVAGASSRNKMLEIV
ncbi:DUF167 domain-containing protein [Candidatus Uhrbacteria bacterium]|nr:DUF167 domain-containing protein [Candidatus Uhrbacteria bacterium]